MLNLKRKRALYNEGVICNNLGNASGEFLKHYKQLYIDFWNADFGEDQRELGAVNEARFIGKRFFGIGQEAFDFIQYEVERNYPTQLKPID